MKKEGAAIIWIRTIVLMIVSCLAGLFWDAGASQAGLVSTARNQFAPQETIRITYSGLPGNAQDWITVVRADAPTNTYGEWFYTQGKTSGSHDFNGLPSGNYEVRVYFNWPSGGYTVQDRYPFAVADASAGGGTGSDKNLAWTKQAVYRSGEAITVEYAGLPGNAQDWITVVQADAPTNTYGEWFYTGGMTSGSRSFKGLAPGNYEVRVYFNWPAGGYTVKDRFPFKVQ